MSKLRPELCTTKQSEISIPDDTALFLIRDSVERRRELIHGKLKDDGLTCALGAFWDDNPKVVLNTSLVDEVAAVNDSMANATPKERWKKVSSWLRWKIAILANKGAKP